MLLTGATGFLGKVVLEALLRRRRELGLDSVLLLLRARDAAGARRRLEAEILASECFRELPPGWERGIQALAGDVTAEGCGLESESRREIQRRVSHVVHCAASIEFDLPLREAAAINAGGALAVLELARGCERLEAMLSVSTAYVTPAQECGAPILEELAPLPEEAGSLLRRIREGEIAEAELLGRTGHPNTYTLTKCLAEHLLASRRGSVPVTLLRPSIVSAARRFPFPGWIDSQAAFAAFVAGLGTGQLRAVAARPDARLDVVPCDEVAARVVEAALEEAPPAGGLRIRHAVAGLERSCGVALCRREIVGYFERHRVGRGPRLAFVGPRGPRFALAELLLHRADAGLAALRHAAARRPRESASARAQAAQRIALNRAFAYFTHATFDFRSSRPLDAGFDPAAYLRSVCRGVQQHLLRQEPDETGFAGRSHGDAAAAPLRLALRRGAGGWRSRSELLAMARALRRCASRASFDLGALEAGRAEIARAERLLLVAGESGLDLALCRLLALARPDLGIEVPEVLPGASPAGEEARAGARRLHALVELHPVLLLPLPRRAPAGADPEAGLVGRLRELQATGRSFALLPAAVTCDRLPEWEGYALPRSGGRAAFSALRRAGFELGRVHLGFGAVLRLDPASEVDGLAREIRAAQSAARAVSTHHLRCLLAQHPVEGVDWRWLRDALRRRGTRVIESRLRAAGSLPPEALCALREGFSRLLAREAPEERGDARALRIAHALAAPGAAAPGTASAADAAPGAAAGARP